jgi:hypothetical protein
MVKKTDPRSATELRRRPATPEELEASRVEYEQGGIAEIDDDALASPVENSTAYWIQAWVYMHGSDEDDDLYCSCEDETPTHVETLDGVELKICEECNKPLPPDSEDAAPDRREVTGRCSECGEPLADCYCDEME